jgi:hypothetical protein
MQSTVNNENGILFCIVKTPIFVVSINSLALLLADTDGAATATSGLGVLTTDTETPVVTETTVRADLLQALEILTELGVDTVGDDLAVLAVDNVALSVEEPGGDLVLGGVLDDGDDTLEFFRGDITSTVYQDPSVNIPFITGGLLSHI